MTGATDTQREWERAARAIAAYNDRQPNSTSDEFRMRDAAEVIAELLGDLHHVGDGLGLSWAGLVERAELYYRGETPPHVVEITAEGFQILDTGNERLRADIWSTREQAQAACDELNGSADDIAVAG
jgi:hypothetical protein